MPANQHRRVSAEIKNKDPETVIVEGVPAYKIPLTRGLYALVDLDDYDVIKTRSWVAYQTKRGVYYSNAHDKYVNGKAIHVIMHHVIFGNPPQGIMIDHKNGNGIDNRKSNLRFCTFKENIRNRKHHRTWKDGSKCSSRFKGVTWDKENRKWAARICVDGKRKTLGRFHSEIEAAKAYDKAAIAAFVDFARPNLSRGKKD